MGLTQTLLFYLFIGIGVAVAVLLRDDAMSCGERLFRMLTAVVFWPLYMPLLLNTAPAAGPAEGVRFPANVYAPSHSDPSAVENSGAPSPRPRDAMDAAIAQVERELDAALNSLSGWAEGVLAREEWRFSELRATWRTQADRIRELDGLLTQPEFVGATQGDSPSVVKSAVDAASGSEEPKIRQIEQARRENIARLRSIRRQMYDDLMGTLAWVRELVTMIHLAKFTGAPASRAEELVAQIAAAVEGLSEVSQWPDEG